MQVFSKRLPQKNKKAATLMAFALIPLSGLVTDVYLPSMPHMATDLQQPDSRIQLTLTLFLVSYGIAQIFIGSIIDSFGRYRLSMISLVFFIVASVVIAQTHSIGMLYAMRVVQGIATGFIVTGKRAFFVDVYDGARLKNYLSMLSIVWSVAPIIAPFIGGYLEFHFQWRANFYLLAGYGVLMLVLEALFSGETIPHTIPFAMKSTVRNYRTMLGSGPFVLGLLMLGLSYGMVMTFGLSGAFIIEHTMNFSAIVAGYISLFLGFAWMLGGFISKASVSKPFIPKLRLANYMQLFFIGLMIVLSAFSSTVYSLVFFAFIIHVTAGFIFNNYFSFTLTRFPGMAGMASGLLGGVNFIVTSIVSYATVDIFHPSSQQSLGICYSVMAAMGFLILNVMVSKKRLSVQTI